MQARTPVENIIVVVGNHVPGNQSSHAVPDQHNIARRRVVQNALGQSPATGAHAARGAAIRYRRAVAEIETRVKLKAREVNPA